MARAADKARGKTTDVANKAWDRTADVAGDVRDFTVEKAPVVGDAIAAAGQASWDKVTDVAPKASEWTADAAALGWAKMKIASKKTATFVTDHDEELLAAMRVVALKASDAALFVAEHDQAIITAVGIVAANHPYVLGAIAAYEVGKPTVKAIAKFLTRLREEGKPEEMSKKDWEALMALLPKLKAAKATGSA